MNQAVKKCHSLFFWLVLSFQVGNTQAKSGLENYGYLTQGESNTWMPVIHYESMRGQYLEFRYNYEAAGTYSLFGGYVFSGGKKIKYETIPMMGYSLGLFEGISFANNTDLEWDKIFLSAQSQYSISSHNKVNDFFFTWMELGYSFSGTLFGGVSMQYTSDKSTRSFEPGIFTGLQIKQFTFPVYLFSPFTENKYWVLGVNFNYDILKKRKNSGHGTTH